MAADPDITYLWQRRGATAFTWELVRECSRTTAAEWLAIFQRDAPRETFVIADKRPRGTRHAKLFRGPGSEY